MARINAEICETTTRGMFVTMVGGIYDPSTGIVRFANAGHEPPLFHDAEGDFHALPAEAPPLGISPTLVDGLEFPETELKLDGGVLYIFTDGVTEGYLEDGRELKVGGLKRLIRENAALNVKGKLNAVIDCVDRGDAELRDDLTLLAIDDAVPLDLRTSGKTVAVEKTPQDPIAAAE